MYQSTDITGSMARSESKKVRKLDEKLLKALREDSVDEAVIVEELNALADDDELDASDSSFRKRLERILESTPLEIFLVVLVVLDVIILLAMLVIDLNILQLELNDAEASAKSLVSLLKVSCESNSELSHYHGYNLKNIQELLNVGGCLWSAQKNQTHIRYRRAAGGGKDINPHAVILIETGHILHVVSIAILAVMVFEVLMKIFTFGSRYFKGKLEVIDGIVIMISFAMDLYFIDGISSTGFNNAASLLVIFLLWRILRVFNALLVTAKKRLQFRIRVQKRMRRTLNEKMQSLEEEIKTLNLHISNLETMSRRHNAPDFEISACKPIVKQTKKMNTSAGLASMMHMSMGLMAGMNNFNRRITENKQDQAANKKNLHSILETNSKKSSTEPNNDLLPESLSDVMKDALYRNERGKMSISSCGSSGFPSVEFTTALATGNQEVNKTGQQLKHIASVEFAKAVALGGTNGKTGSSCDNNSLRSKSEVEDISAKVRTKSVDANHMMRSNPTSLLPRYDTSEQVKKRSSSSDCYLERRPLIEEIVCVL